MKRRFVCFAGPRRITVCEEPCPEPGVGQVLVKADASAISAGTELLLYRGRMPRDLEVDETIESLKGRFAYPMKYGYATVGRVTELGSEVDVGWEGRKVFCFAPHQSHFVAAPEGLVAVPEELTSEVAAMLASMETAVSLVMDGRPSAGEQVAVFGQGVVGLLTAALLSRVPLASLVTLDPHPLRREKSLAAGASAALDPDAPDAGDRLLELLREDRHYAGADLTYELSGDPATLNQAIAATGFDGRIVVGSWYGTQQASIDLGSRFHRSKMSLISSQVSCAAPRWSGRWSKARRLDLAWSLLIERPPADLITHRIPVAEAAEAYRLLDEEPASAIQVVLLYDAAP